MNIDWLTVTAQLLNFLILVFMLRHFLYRPLLDVMAKRESVINDRLKHADHQASAAQQSQQHYQSLADDLSQKKDDLLRSARQQADNERQQLTEHARQDIAALKVRWQADFDAEKKDFIGDLCQQCGLSVLRVARRALSDLTDITLEQQLVTVFSERLGNLSAADRETIHAAAAHPAEVTSSFIMDENQRHQICRSLGDAAVQFTVDPAMLFGIELVNNGEKVSWSISDYFDQLEQQLEAALENPAN